ncbi:efflux RND transporter periplasmic adaptor subunit [Paenibacillus sp. RC67]|uniref:efflux RND transporter periplasmic adaptor subunit n=1 Tax=Paenibacillus sp. RC67 TaxID=3039392 RepID=UPI0024AD3A1C|nr:efflux RND transporter periplasmic adaptor subunit [Paenibacillus sp. RC67]
MEVEQASVDRRRKRNIQIVFMAFIGLLVFFTLFSNTLQSATLPKVRTEKSAKGSLVQKLEGSGTLRPLAEVKLSNPAGWRVQKLLVKEGDRVKKGQQLIIYDSKSAERELQDQITQLEKLQIELQNSQDQFIQTTTEGDAFKNRSVIRDIETRKLDLGMQERKIDEMKERLVSKKEAIAPFDGIITKTNAVEGLVSSGEPDIGISNSNQGYRFEFTADTKLLLSLGLALGQKLEVEVHTVQDQGVRTIEGLIEEMATTEPRTESSSSGDSLRVTTIPQQLLRIKVTDAELKGGEQALIKLEKRSSQEGLNISNTAIHQDREGKFVFKIEEQMGALGNTFVARKVRIYASETNDHETLVNSGNLYEGDLIIVESSEPLQDGNRVRLQ